MNERVFIENEIEALRHELAVSIPQEIQAAIELGDLRENSEFSAAVTKQHFVSVRLNQLLNRLHKCHPVDIDSIPKDRVGLESIVKVKNIEMDTIVDFKIVTIDFIQHTHVWCELITLDSPIGKALHNKRVGDTVKVILPKGEATYIIIELVTIHDQ